MWSKRRVLMAKVSAARCGCLLAVLAPDHELQSGPRLIDRANFHIHEIERQTDVANNVLGDIRRNSGGLLWPRNPDDAGVIDDLAQALQFFLQQPPLVYEEMNESRAGLRFVRERNF